MPGHTIAFEENFSTSGYMLPLAHMIEAGLQPIEIAEPGDEVGDNQVGFVFSGDDENTIQWVVSNRVSVGVVDSSTYSEIAEEIREQLRIVAETEALPRHVVVVRPGMEPELVDSITAVLTAMDESDEGKATLESFEDTAQFDEFPGGIDTALARMRELYGLVTQE
jgi:phosphonate transport system substrate-binding protein